MKFTAILLSATAMLLATGAQAKTFNFSLNETFDYGNGYPSVLTGNLVGDLNGNLITKLSDVNLFLNGKAFKNNGSLFTGQFNGNTYVNSGYGQLSLDGTANNALIIDTDFANGDYNYSSYFYSTSLGDEAVNYPEDYGFNNRNAIKLQITQGTAVGGNVGAVPEPATWAMMIAGFGMVGFAMRRRQSVETTVRFA